MAEDCVTLPATLCHIRVQISPKISDVRSEEGLWAHKRSMVLTSVKNPFSDGFEDFEVLE